ncbi:cytochrome c biogenesis protein ResB [Geomesophilobacter sediminis]|nr:cytochrome c biogenesis protein ResB [Geomesophilobacter sediminis]
MKSPSFASRVLFVSPLTLIVFLIIPVAVILSFRLHLGIPFLNFNLLLANNICFALLAIVRLLWYLGRSGKEIRYGEGGRPSSAYATELPLPEARSVLARGGFVFGADGTYGEKRDRGYLGTVLLYVGLSVVLATGSWNNLRQFAGVVLDGVGPATPLSKPEAYRSLTRGPLAPKMESLPQLRVLSQILPDSTYLRGGTEIALIPAEGKPASTVLLPPTPYVYQNYDIYMTKIVFTPEVIIKTKAGALIFDGFVQLDPLVQKRGVFSFYGPFAGDQAVGGVYYAPDKNLMMMVVTRNNQKVVGDLVFQADQEVTAGDYVLSVAKLGQWSEIHIVHHRNKALLWLGGIIAVLGLAVRLALRPQRVWLDEGEQGCRVASVGRDAKTLLAA